MRRSAVVALSAEAANLFLLTLHPKSLLCFSPPRGRGEIAGIQGPATTSTNPGLIDPRSLSTGWWTGDSMVRLCVNAVVLDGFR